MENIDNFKIKTEAINLLQEGNEDAWIEFVTSGKKMQELLGISDVTLNRYYSVAKDLLHEKNWADAKDVFNFLTLLNPFMFQFWIGLGISEIEQGKYLEALAAFTMSETID